MKPRTATLAPKGELRFFTSASIEAAAEIDSLANSHPWKDEDFNISVNLGNNGNGRTYFVDDQMVGFAIYYLHPRSVDLLNIAVHPKYQGCGIGSMLLADIVTRLVSGKRSFIRAIVRETRSNSVAMWFANRGFTDSRLVRNVPYDVNLFCDAFDMRYHVGGGPEKS